MNMESLIEKAREQRGSDVHLVQGLPPKCRVDGSIQNLEEDRLDKEQCLRFAHELAGEDFPQLEQAGEVDLARTIAEVRCRINVFRQQGAYSAAIRLLNDHIPPLEELGLPPVAQEFCSYNQGLVLITGETGSGKSTTLASLLDRINHTKPVHILTLEDPVEYIYTPDQSLINQREIGRDTMSFAAGLRAALREDPDVILVGDSASNVMAGNVTTLPITLNQMIYHGKSVVRGVKRALVVVDMPFGTYQTSEYEAVTNAIKIMKITHADALKLEGGEEIIDAVKKIISAGIPIMGHLGLMPQSINKYGTYTVRAKDDAEAEKLVRDAHLLEDAGCFGLVLEKIPAALAERVAKELTIPVIGIGAGGNVDGQVLVVADMLGMTDGFRPRFLRRYADLHTVMKGAIGQYVEDVKSGDFPNENEQY